MSKTKYNDYPRYKAIVGYENQFKNQFADIVGVMTKNIKHQLKSFIKK